MHVPHEQAPLILSTWKLVVLAVAVTGVAGFAAGLLYRAGAAIILTFITAATGFFLSSQQGFSFWQSTLYALGLITILQVGYLAGASLAVTLVRTNAKPTMRSLIASLFKQKTAP
jgi:hypothetical protein